MCDERLRLSHLLEALKHLNGLTVFVVGVTVEAPLLCGLTDVVGSADVEVVRCRPPPNVIGGPVDSTATAKPVWIFKLAAIGRTPHRQIPYATTGHIVAATGQAS